MANSEKKSAKKSASKIDDLSVIMEEAGVITDGNADKFIDCIAKHRFWNREEFRKVPA